MHPERSRTTHLGRPRSRNHCQRCVEFRTKFLRTIRQPEYKRKNIKSKSKIREIKLSQRMWRSIV